MRPDTVAAMLFDLVEEAHKARWGAFDIPCLPGEAGARIVGSRPGFSDFSKIVVANKKFQPMIPPLSTAPNAWQKAAIEAACVAAAQGGAVEPGALLSESGDAGVVPALAARGKSKKASAHAAE
jgi:hypothetical protein